MKKVRAAVEVVDVHEGGDLDEVGHAGLRGGNLLLARRQAVQRRPSCSGDASPEDRFPARLQCLAVAI